MDLESLKTLLREHLTLEVQDGNFTMPNSRKLILSLGGEEIATAYFDVKDSPEYEG